MKYSLARILSATVVGAVLTGCATVPGDPYYAPAHYPVYEQPGVVYQAPPVYRTPPVIYPYAAPPPAIYFEGRERDHNRWSPPAASAMTGVNAIVTGQSGIAWHASGIAATSRPVKATGWWAKRWRRSSAWRAK